MIGLEPHRMVCKFHAATQPTMLHRIPLLTLVAALPLMGMSSAVQAERADRTKPMVVESDGKQAASVDLARKLTLINGNVVISQGTLEIKADRVEVREPEAGVFTALAVGSAAQPATFRQKRDRVNEYLEAQAERIEYDGALEKVRFVGAARLRVLRAGVVSDEASAAVIVYDQRVDTIVFEGGGLVTPGAVPGKARLVFVPRAAASGASAAEAGQ
ncbi:lipopolysaccharide transport periplasmic protein LptA [Ideonella sp.]|uniref:lipopolysaccharide transport periplasmic protein LptA n=1 Tax=Ideonella sp. TaxID=1929293 RepID=UPI003BB62064